MAAVLTDAASAVPPINVFRALANAPSLAPDYIRYFVHLFKQLELDARTERLIVLLIGKLSGCEYIWRQNVVVELHKGNLEARCFSQARRAAFRFAKEALERIEVTDATYAEAAVHFSSRALLEILYVIGSYMFLARVIRTGRIPLDETPAEVPDKVFDWFSNRPALRRADEVAARSEYE
jgi:alkylhydroperoxidase family enzyme